MVLINWDYGVDTVRALSLHSNASWASAKIETEKKREKKKKHYLFWLTQGKAKQRGKKGKEK